MSIYLKAFRPTAMKEFVRVSFVRLRKQKVHNLRQACHSFFVKKKIAIHMSE